MSLDLFVNHAIDIQSKDFAAVYQEERDFLHAITGIDENRTRDFKRKILAAIMQMEHGNLDYFEGNPSLLTVLRDDEFRIKVIASRTANYQDTICLAANYFSSRYYLLYSTEVE